MDFTPPSNPPIQANPISSIPSSRKLPIKRKTPNSNSNSNSNSSLFLNPESPNNNDVTNNNPPFKFHRVWSEPDEIRLLQGLLDCSSKGLSFPKDLGIFYNIFSNGMSQPYSKSQLSEKLRRLRKKFRVISSRLANGFDKDLLSVQDRTLYDLSKQLWEPVPDHGSLPFVGTKVECKLEDDNNNNNNDKCKTSMGGVGVEGPSYTMAVLALPSVVKKTNTPEYCSDKFNKVDGAGLKEDGFNVNDGAGLKEDGYNVNEGGDVELVGKEVRVEKSFGEELSGGIVRFASTTLADVVERSLKEMRSRIDVRRVSSLEKEMSFERRWRDQYVAEFDVLAKRLKLIVEGSSMVGK